MSNIKRYDLHCFIKEHNHDIILLSETKLNPKHKIHFDSYKLLRTDRPNSTQGGGTAILIKDNIPHKKVDYPSSCNNQIIEYTIINLTNLKPYNFYIISLYATNDN